MDPRFLFKDWGIWGWTWALGWFGFVLGLVLVPEVTKGAVPSLVLLVPLAGAALMVASSRLAGGSTPEKGISMQ